MKGNGYYTLEIEITEGKGCIGCTLHRNAYPPEGLDGGAQAVYPQCLMEDGKRIIISQFPILQIPPQARCSLNFDQE